MDSVKLAVTKRVPGKKFVKEARKNGMLPINIYGKAVETNITGAIEHKRIIKALQTPHGRNIVVTLEVEGKNISAIPYAIAINPVKNSVSHIDFLAVNPDDELVVNVPVVKQGRSQGEIVGGKALLVVKELAVRCKVEKIPVNIVVDVTPYNIGDRIMISNITLPEGVQAVFRKDSPVIVINKGRGQATETDEAETAAPAAAAPKAEEKKEGKK